MVIDFSKQIGKRISVQGNKKIFINMEEIMYIQCEDHLSILFLSNGVKIYEIKTLCQFEKELTDFGFFRIRDNTIINGKYITEIDTKMNKRAVKLEKIEFIIAKRRLKSFIHWLK